jgi:tripartite-type tricarboxylate transporter receptor subunit TctC
MPNSGGGERSACIFGCWSAFARSGKLNNEVNPSLADPRLRTRLAELGATPLAGSPTDFAKLIVEEIEKWGKVVKFSGAKPE